MKQGTFKKGRCTIIVSKDAGNWHLSISTPNGSPTYKEIKSARYEFLPDNILVGQLFPPKEEFVNLHPYCHHLWEIKEDTLSDRLTEKWRRFGYKRSELVDFLLEIEDELLDQGVKIEIKIQADDNEY